MTDEQFQERIQMIRRKRDEATAIRDHYKDYPDGLFWDWMIYHNGERDGLNKAISILLDIPMQDLKDEGMENTESILRQWREVTYAHTGTEYGLR